MLVRFSARHSCERSAMAASRALCLFFALILYPVILFLGTAAILVRGPPFSATAICILVKVVNIPNQYWKFNILVNIRTVDDVV